MIIHVVGVKEGHLFLDSAKDTGIAGVKTNDEMAFVVMLLHQCALLFECHIGRRAHHGAWLVAVGEFLGHQ